MRHLFIGLSAIAMLASATPVLAQDEAGPVTISGSASLVSDYRFRGFTQNGEKAAVQGGLTLTHEGGLYLGTWGSSVDFPDLDGSGNGLTTEIDFFAGFSREVSPGITADVGILYYLYPKKLVTDVDTDFFEPYVNLSGSIGPISMKVGANYAWKQNAIGDYSSVYLHAEPSVSVPNTPLGLNAHVGYAISDSFLGGPDGETFDYSLGGTLTYKAVTLGVSYVNTDVRPKLAKEALGADGAVVFSLTAAF